MSAGSSLINDIQTLRLRFRGDKSACLAEFKEAWQNNKPTNQIVLAFTRYAMLWGKDASIDKWDWIKKQAKDLTVFSLFYHQGMDILTYTYYDIDPSVGFQKCEILAHQTCAQAAEEKFVPAIIIALLDEWKQQRDYGLALKLQPFAGKGDQEIDYHFGSAVRQGSAVGSQLFYRGVLFMLPIMEEKEMIKFPKNETFEHFASYFIRCNNSSTYFDLDGLWWLSSGIVLAPSINDWNEWKTSKLCSLPKHTLIPLVIYDGNQIKNLMKQYKLSGISGSNGIGIYELTFYSDQYRVGRIAFSIQDLQSDLYKLVATVQDERFQPVIDLLQNTMLACGSAHSACAIMRHFSG